MNNLELLIKEFRQHEGSWLVVGGKEEKVRFDSLEINSDMTEILLLFAYKYSSIEIKINQYASDDNTMLMHIPEDLHFTSFIKFVDNKGLTLFLNQILRTWLKREIDNNGIRLIWED